MLCGYCFGGTELEHDGSIFVSAYLREYAHIQALLTVLDRQLFSSTRHSRNDVLIDTIDAEETGELSRYENDVNVHNRLLKCQWSHLKSESELRMTVQIFF